MDKIGAPFSCLYRFFAPCSSKLSQSLEGVLFMNRSSAIDQCGLMARVDRIESEHIIVNATSAVSFCGKLTSMFHFSHPE